MGDGAWMPGETMPDISFSTTSPGDIFLTEKVSSADKDLLQLLESTGLQGLLNGEDLASCWPMETWTP